MYRLERAVLPCYVLLCTCPRITWPSLLIYSALLCAHTLYDSQIEPTTADSADYSTNRNRNHGLRDTVAKRGKARQSKAQRSTAKGTARRRSSAESAPTAIAGERCISRVSRPLQCGAPARKIQQKTGQSGAHGANSVGPGARAPRAPLARAGQVHMTVLVTWTWPGIVQTRARDVDTGYPACIPPRGTRREKNGEAKLKDFCSDLSSEPLTVRTYDWQYGRSVTATQHAARNPQHSARSTQNPAQHAIVRLQCFQQQTCVDRGAFVYTARCRREHQRHWQHECQPEHLRGPGLL